MYRAVDKQGRTVDFLLRERRDVAAAKRFFRTAVKNNGTPRVVTLDAYAASHRAIAELKATGTMPRRVRIRSSKYLNNVVEQDHRRIKQRVRPMLGFKRFDTAAVTITGIELAEKIKKDQFKIGKLPGRPATAPEIWAALLAACDLRQTSERRSSPSLRVCTRSGRTHRSGSEHHMRASSWFSEHRNCNRITGRVEQRAHVYIPCLPVL